MYINSSQSNIINTMNSALQSILDRFRFCHIKAKTFSVINQHKEVQHCKGKVSQSEAGYTLDRSPVHLRVTHNQQCTLIHTPKGNLERPINLTGMFLDCGR
ncbi:hypothetical protein ILYODFUR_010900 [Ilyodon furcidens]|uniref:Uncharacterized protein n=1 Tax=Ilyodon furcidens TaxID=33524 RepID=A0ABV0THM1_9TELE